ncbi:cache domain-containing protein [Tanticharoenia sakaeratensis]|uniref:Adenylate cyclase n=1 Tax=Tanticharoenia sakaeratensis NBRC 103193 TaxID=1231623 RepID=A0A0D6MJF4_9PROT|nr:cache domain-containing protein [Tanticharoenia sakaeratensis]GAN53742.1 adenylate cyclase [Tanticharoenia sakaeratensis NBRC 103193]GBQ17042.1 two component hybrid sensor histidine kinase and regulator [Tanticharoenia sakaeratensis NBRC 103193]
MPSYEIVDPSQRRSQERRHIFWRLGGPVLGVIAVIAAIIATAMHSYTTSREGALSLTRDLLQSQQHYITQEVADYLAPASSGVVIAHDLLHAANPSETPRMFSDFSVSALRHVPQVASLYLADAKGTFWLVERDRAGGPGWETTHLETDHDKRIFRHWYYDDAGHLTKITTAPAGTFDPTKEVWFGGAANQPGVAHDDDKLFWSQPYPFPPTKQPIITSSLAYRQPDGTVSVLAMNILLQQMSGFLDKMNIGRSGKAVIVDNDGQVIAGPGMPTTADPQTWDAQRVKLDAHTQPVFQRTLAMYRVYGPGGRAMTVGKTRYVTIAANVPLTDSNRWILLLNAPASDFAGFAIAARKQTFIFSIVIVGLASGLALFLILQERKTDRVQGRLDALRTAIDRRHRALQQVVGAHDLFDATHDVPKLTEVLAEIAVARRASIWRFLDDGGRLVCEDAFDTQRDAHSTGVELSGPEFAAFLKTAHSGQPFDVSDMSHDDSLRAFYRIVMRPAGFSHLVVAPVMSGDRVLGIITLEDARETAEAEPFTRVIADVVAIRLRHAGVQQSAAEQSGGEAPQHVTEAMRFGDDFLLLPDGRDDGDGTLPSGRYPMVPVLMVTFDEPVGAETIDPEKMLPIVRQLADHVQDIARSENMFAVRVVGRRLLVIGACAEEPDPDAAVRVADAALAIREACLTTLADADVDPIFRMGIDVAQAFGDHFGNDPKVFNLWGDSVAGAELMAEAAPQPGTIQVSENAYTLLRAHYLFRPRGLFYRPRLGITRTFILAGRR